MKAFGYFSVTDSKKEIVKITQAYDINQAIHYFSLLKNLSIYEFEKLFLTIEIK